MGYRIEYGGENHKDSGRQISTGRTVIMCAAVFLCFVVAVKNWWSDGWDALKTILFPGDLVTVKSAAENFVHAVNDGQSLTDAVTTFCIQIIANG